MSEKIKVELPNNVEIDTVGFLGKNVEVKHYISLEDYGIIAEDIRSNVLYNDEIIDKYAMLEIRATKDILDLYTNIDTSEMTAEELASDEIWCFIQNNIYNIDRVMNWLDEEYNKFVIENSLGLLGGKMPDSKEIEKSMDIIAQTVKDLPEDKLELIAKSIAWNNAPAVAQQIAPVEHIKSVEKTDVSGKAEPEELHLVQK